MRSGAFGEERKPGMDYRHTLCPLAAFLQNLELSLRGPSLCITATLRSKCVKPTGVNTMALPRFTSGSERAAACSGKEDPSMSAGRIVHISQCCCQRISFF